MRFGYIVEYQGRTYRAGAHGTHAIDVATNDPDDLRTNFRQHAPGREHPSYRVDASARGRSAPSQA